MKERRREGIVRKNGGREEDKREGSHSLAAEESSFPAEDCIIMGDIET